LRWRAGHRARLGLLALLLGAGVSQAAAEVVFLPPVGCLPADGGPPVWIHLVVSPIDGQPAAEPPPIAASRGRLDPPEPLGRGTYRLRFHPPRDPQAERLRLTVAGQDGIELPLCARPAGRIAIAAEPASLLAGQGQRAVLRIRALDAAGRPVTAAPIQITANVGRVGPVRALGDGRYRAVFIPPDDPFPQVAILMAANPRSARLDRVAVGRAVVPITARVELPGETAPGTRMQMRVAGRVFGPVRADARGRFELPILVPPGIDRGRATSIDRAGNRKTRTIELFLPETKRLGLWAYPLRLPADGQARSRLLVTTIDRFGRPQDLKQRSRGLQIEAERGRVGSLRHLDRGLYEAYYTAPASTGDGRVTIRVGFPRAGSKSRAEVQLRLLPGPAQQVKIEAPDLLAADGASRGRLVLRVADGRGNPVPGRLVTLAADPGRILDLKEVEPGLHRAALVVGAQPQRWISTISARVRDRAGGRPERLLLDGEALAVDDAGRMILTAVLVDGLGLPVPHLEVRLRVGDAESRSKTGAFGRVRLEVPGPGGPGVHSGRLTVAGVDLVKPIHWFAGGGRAWLLPIGLAAALPPAKALTARADVRLHPPAGARIALRALAPAEPGRIWTLEIEAFAADGRALDRERLQPSASIGSIGPLRTTSPGHHRAGWTPPAAEWSRAVISVADGVTGAGAVTRIERGREAL
jgi:hypothetical protein